MDQPKSPSEPSELTVFEAARHIADPRERASYLETACHGDAALREQVEQLLSLQAEADREFEQAAQEVPRAIVDALSVEAPAPARERVGDRIDRYQLVQKLGEGGCGVVYLAEQQEPLRRQVALKIIKLGMDTQEVIARFEAERQALAVLDHPNIAKVFDAGATTTGRPYFVMELVPGVRITEFCDQNHRPAPDRLRLFIQVCQAVQHAHQKGIIHRDLKPSNVLVILQDGLPVPKVIDFGIAKATTGQRLTDKTLFTAFEQFLGTPAYMSPEQAELSGVDIDTRSDIYGLGVLLYELLTGRTPFDARELLKAGFDEMRRTIREKEPLRPSTRLSALHAIDLNTVADHRRTDIPNLLGLMRGDLDWIVMKCLEKDRNRRYDTATGLAHDVQRYLQDEPVLAGPPTATYRLHKFVRKHRRSVAGAAAFVALLITAAIGGSSLAIKANREKGRAIQAQQEAETVLSFFQDRVLAAARPRAEKGALGHDATIRDAVIAAERHIGDSFSNAPLVEASVRDVLGTTYIHLGAYSNAVQQHERALQLWRANQRGDSPRALSTMNNLAMARQKSGRVQQAVPLLEEVLATRRRQLGPEDPLTLLSMNNLATAYGGAGRKEEALKLHEETLRIRKITLGIAHPYTLSSMASLGSTYRSLGRLPEAVTTLTEALELHKVHLGQEHPYTADCTVQLAKALRDSGRTNEALPLFRDALRLTRMHHPQDHPYIISSLRDLANLYLDTGNPKEACGLFEEVWKTERSRSGPNQPVTLRAQNDLALALHKAGRSAEAVPLAEEALRTSLETLDSNHNTTLRALELFTVASRETGRIREALPPLDDYLRQAEAGPAATNGVVLDITEVFVRTWIEQGLLSRDLSARIVATLDQSLAQRVAAGSFSDSRTQQLLNLVTAIHDSLGELEKAAEWRRKFSQRAP
ncbi:MAG TPA: serine/threonine-protein kinase [Verrucomicrobiae bacterium]|nr:serine/threonine-protein kinase [Verrucomicrobiae bacterium]